jgi:hypothetical protein
MSKYLKALKNKRQAFQTGGSVASLTADITNLNVTLTEKIAARGKRASQGGHSKRTVLRRMDEEIASIRNQISKKQEQLAKAVAEQNAQPQPSTGTTGTGGTGGTSEPPSDAAIIQSAADTPTGQEAIAGQSVALGGVTSPKPDPVTLPDAKEGLDPTTKRVNKFVEEATDEEFLAAFETQKDDIQQLETGRELDTATITKEGVGQATPQAAAQVSTAFDSSLSVEQQQQINLATEQEFTSTPEFKEYKELSDSIMGSEQYKAKLLELQNAEQDPRGPAKADKISRLRSELDTMLQPLKSKKEALDKQADAIFKRKQQEEISKIKPSVETATMDVALTQEIQDELGPPQGSAAKVLEQVDVTTIKSSKETGQGLAEQGIDNEISNAIANDPEGALEKLEGTDLESRANIADLPEEALMSAQMEGLLAGMEEGKTPLWAKPAVDKVNAILAARGMSVSTVGRDQLFNAIIQSAMPIAQDNAKALQARAAQKLDAAVKFRSQEAEFEQQMKVVNLSNQQEAYMAKLKFKQDNMLSDQAAKNAAAQFNATSENQTQQFMASLQNNIEQFNVAAENAMKQFNIVEQNKMEALNAGNELAVEQFNIQQLNNMTQFYEQNEFNMSTLEQTNLWQQLRDTASYIRDSYQRDQDRKTTLLNTVIGLENMTKYSHSQDLSKSINNINDFLSALDF